MDSETSLYVLGAVIAGIGIKPLISFVANLWKTTEDTEKNIEQSKKESALEIQIKLQKIELKQEQQDKEIDDLKKKSNIAEKEMIEIKVVQTKLESMQKQIDSMELAQVKIIDKLDRIIELKTTKV